PLTKEMVMRIRTTAFSMFAVAVVLASPCVAQAVKAVPLSFFVTVAGTSSTSSCTFQGVSFSTSISHTLTQLASNPVSLSNLLINKAPDYCSPTLFQLVYTGASMPTVVISVQANINGAT